MAGRRAQEDAASIEVLEDREHVAAAGPGRVAECCGGEGLAARQREPKAGFPGNYIVMPALNRAFDNWWANAPGPGGVGLQDRYAAAWRHVAERFRNERYLMGYDLLNEPWPGSPWSSCANTEGCPVFDEQSLTPFSRRATNRIREVDQRNIVWYEPNVIFNNGPATHHGDTGPLAGMSFHIYCLSEGNTPTRSPFDPAQAQECETFEALPFQRAEEQSVRTDDTLLLSEFGATDDIEQIERIAEKADRNIVGGSTGTTASAPTRPRAAPAPPRRSWSTPPRRPRGTT